MRILTGLLNQAKGSARKGDRRFVGSLTREKNAKDEVEAVAEDFGRDCSQCASAGDGFFRGALGTIRLDASRACLCPGRGSERRGCASRHSSQVTKFF